MRLVCKLVFKQSRETARFWEGFTFKAGNLHQTLLRVACTARQKTGFCFKIAGHHPVHPLPISDELLWDCNHTNRPRRPLSGSHQL
ncbi:hypothetical protein CVIRNUC_006651 [Coccomyxa viridis]|uniref:Uncharacterized protein n=1 Tax=Coccomyxa viridis TaxID=1274662 RepID=A0AAV1I8P1_9CHLO|nr:hypothetical protein CVIRNUC_006651 [Coccomyxa viridis]